MSTREKAMSLIDSLPEKYVEQLNIVLSNPKMLEELLDEIECNEIVRQFEADTDPNKFDGVPIEEAAAILGVTL